MKNSTNIFLIYLREFLFSALNATKIVTQKIKKNRFFKKKKKREISKNPNVHALKGYFIGNQSMPTNQTNNNHFVF